MRYIELTLMDGQKLFLNVNGICSVKSYDGNAKSIVTCLDGKEHSVCDTYENIIMAILGSWGLKNKNGK